jgi:N-acetylglutamate synthase-like GNAT family acetyltransferase
VHIRTDIRPGDIGAIVRMHGEVYGAEQGWDWTFEAYVADTLARFAEQFDPRTDRLWLAEDAGEVVGSIAIVHAEPGVAQLRWYLVHPSARGSGIGRRLLHDAIAFCRAASYTRIFLLTASDLPASAHLYGEAGFVATSHTSCTMWGAALIEERHELQLTP